MGLHNYAAKSSEFAQEIAADLTSEDIHALAVELKSMGWRSWLRWQDEFESEIVDYVSVTPAVRAKKVKWREPALRRQLILASITHCLAAHALLRFFADHECELSAGGSYRDTTALAGNAYWKIVNTEIPDWPDMFERVCPSPFD